MYLLSDLPQECQLWIEGNAKVVCQCGVLLPRIYGDTLSYKDSTPDTLTLVCHCQECGLSTLSVCNLPTGTVPSKFSPPPWIMPDYRRDPTVLIEVCKSMEYRLNRFRKRLELDIQGVESADETELISGRLRDYKIILGSLGETDLAYHLTEFAKSARKDHVCENIVIGAWDARDRANSGNLHYSKKGAQFRLDRTAYLLKRRLLSTWESRIARILGD